MEKLEKLLETVLNQQTYSTETQEIIDRVRVNSRRQRRLYEGILSNTPDWAYILDPSHRFIYANRSLLNDFGKSWDEVIGKKLSELVDTPIDQQYAELDQVISNKEQVRGELHIETDDGEQIYDYIFVPILKNNGEVEAVAGTCRDITDKKVAERELEHELTSMRSLQDMSAKLMLQGDTQQQLDEVLSTSIDIMNADKGTIQLFREESNRLVLRAHRGYSDDFVSAYKEFDKNDDTCPTTALEEQERILIPDIRPSEALSDQVRDTLEQEDIRAVQSTLLRSRTNQILGIITTHWENPYDPTERQFSLLNLLARQVSNWIEQYRINKTLRETRQRLETANNFLEQRIEKRTEKLQERASKMQDLAAKLTTAKQQERKRIATILHDDLQQLLVSAKMHIGFLTEDIQGSGNKNADKAVEMIDQAVEVSRNLTSRLHPPALHEDGYLSALQWLASDMKERHHLKVEIKKESEDFELHLDDQVKVLLFECTRELLFNIVKYAEVDEALVHLNESGEYLNVTIEDEGLGFDVEEAKENTEGFGLFSVLERLEAFGGSAIIDSEPGKGTTIHLKVPLNKDTLEEDTPEHIPEEQIKVLIVDDHAMVREGITNILQTDRRLNIDQAKDGLEAVEMLEEESFEVVLMDVRTPRMNGIEATQIIHSRWPETVVIGMSAREDEDTEQAILEAGAAKFIPKSGDSRQMTDIISGLAGDRKE